MRIVGIDVSEEMKYYTDNIERFDDSSYELYKKTFWKYHYSGDDKKHKTRTFTVKNIPFKKPISYLTLVDHEDHIIKEINSLPKNLKVLWLQGFTQFGWSLPVEVIPKSIVTIVLRWCWNPLQGKDLRSLKSLKVFQADDSSASVIPIFPKSIVYITMKGNRTLFYLGVNFKLSDYPKLKYVNFKGSIDPKKVPKEWKDAKKSGKLEIIW